MKNNRRFATAEEARQAGVGSLPDALVAEKFGISRQAIAFWRKVFAIPPPNNKKLDLQPYISFMSQHPEATWREVSAHFEKSEGAIEHWAKKCGVFPKDNPPYVPASRWTDNQIVSALSGARSLREAAKVLGTHEGHLHYMLRTRNLRASARIPDGRKKK